MSLFHNECKRCCSRFHSEGPRVSLFSLSGSTGSQFNISDFNKYCHTTFFIVTEDVLFEKKKPICTIAYSLDDIFIHIYIYLLNSRLEASISDK